MEELEPDSEEPHGQGGTLFVVLSAVAFIVIALSAAYIAITWNG